MRVPKAGQSKEQTPWERFEDFSKRLLAVPIEEVREKQAEYEAEKPSNKSTPRGVQKMIAAGTPKRRRLTHNE